MVLDFCSDRSFDGSSKLWSLVPYRSRQVHQMLSDRSQSKVVLVTSGSGLFDNSRQCPRRV